PPAELSPGQCLRPRAQRRAEAARDHDGADRQKQPSSPALPADECRPAVDAAATVAQEPRARVSPSPRQMLDRIASTRRSAAKTHGAERPPRGGEAGRGGGTDRDRDRGRCLSPFPTARKVKPAPPPSRTRSESGRSGAAAATSGGPVGGRARAVRR